MEQKLVFDHLTIEEYVHNSSVLAAGLSRNGPDDSAYISLIRDTGKIPLIMQAIEKDNKNTVATDWYSTRALGCNVVGYDGERNVLTTRSDGSIFIEVNEEGKYWVYPNTKWKVN